MVTFSKINIFLYFKGILQNLNTMRKTTLVLAVLLFTNLQLYSQFTDGMEYPNGIPTSSTWWGDCTISEDCIEIVDFYANSGQYSGQKGPGPGTNITLLDLGSKTSGEWGLAFYMFMPGIKEGYLSLQGVVPMTNGEWIVGNIFFNQDGLAPGDGYMDNTALGTVSFNYPLGEWFRVVINVDITNGTSLATWQFGVNGVEVIPAGTAFTNLAGDIPTSLGGVDFFSISGDNEYYVDDFENVNGVLDLLLNVDENEILKFSVSPNPVAEKLNIATHSNIVSSRIYSLQGSTVYNGTSNQNIDVSQLASGVYFLQVETIHGKSIERFVKN